MIQSEQIPQDPTAVESTFSVSWCLQLRHSGTSQISESDKESGTERKRRVDTEKLLLFFCDQLREDEEIIYLCRVSLLF